MRTTRNTFLALAVAAGAVATRAPLASAQIFIGEPVHSANRGLWHLDIGGQYAQPIGEFRDNVNSAWGAGVSVRYHFPRLQALGLRADFSMLNYGNERKRVPLSQTVNRVMVDMRTTNNILVAGLGPELVAPGGPVRPYVFGFVGYSYFYTQSSAGDDNGSGSFASTTNFDDGGLATGFGGGVRIPIRTRRTRLAIDAGAHVTRSGTRTYLTRGDITDQSDGSLSFSPRTSTANFWQYHLGVSFSPR